METIKRDCLAFNGSDRSCGALNALYCKKGKCRFYKNKAMLDKQVEKIRKRIPDYDPSKISV